MKQNQLRENFDTKYFYQGNVVKSNFVSLYSK